MRVLTWNVRRCGAERIGSIARAIRASRADVVALQEVPVKRAADLTLASGYRYEALGHRTGDQLAYASMILSRFPLAARSRLRAPLPELVVHAVARTTRGSIEVLAVHAPNGARHGWKKIDTFEAIAKRLRAPSRMPRIVLGDLNAPQTEESGKVITWAMTKTRKGEWKPFGSWTVRGESGKGDRFDRAEGWLFRPDSGHGLQRAIRWSSRAWSIEVAGVRRCFDHIFLSKHFRVQRARYVHSWRRWSDHAPLMVDVGVRPALAR